MGLIDINQLPNKNYDVVIVGAGAAGYTIASELNNTELSVLLIEGGDYNYTQKSQEVYKGKLESGLKHADLHIYRQRHLGGSTNCWGGGCLPFDPIDFAGREDLNLPEWPINYNEVIPFYKRAEYYTGIDGYDGNFNSSNKRIAIHPKISTQSTLVQKHWRINADRKNFRDNFHEILEKSNNIDICLKSNAISIIKNKEINSIQSLGVQDFNKNSFEVKGKNFILCCGGIETTKLMLNWTESEPTLFSEIKESLGHYYSPHINLFNGLLIPQDKNEIKNDYFSVTKSTKERAFISFSEQYLKDNKLLNFKSTFQSTKASSNTEKNINDMIKYMSNKSFFPDKNIYKLQTAFDQSPHYDSKISLNSDLDSFGLKQVTLQHRVSDKDIESINNVYLHLAKSFSSLGIGRFAYKSAEECFKTQEIGRSHHTGTTRMSKSKHDGVVDSNLKVHGVNNLFISSSSNFPTPSQANPTFTIIALSIKLADYIKEGKNS